MTDFIEVVVPGSREGDAAAALASLRRAALSRKREDAVAAVRGLRRAADWLYGCPAWERICRAADRIELRLRQGQPWLRGLRASVAELAPLLEGISGAGD